MLISDFEMKIMYLAKNPMEYLVELMECLNENVYYNVFYGSIVNSILLGCTSHYHES